MRCEHDAKITFYQFGDSYVMFVIAALFSCGPDVSCLFLAFDQRTF